MFSFEIIKLWKPLRFWVSIPDWHRASLLKSWISTRWQNNLLFSCLYDDTVLKIWAFIFLDKQASLRPDVLSLSLGLALLFPSPAYGSIPVGVKGSLGMGRAGCLNPWGKDHPGACSQERRVALLQWKRQGGCGFPEGWGRLRMLGSRGAGSFLVWWCVYSLLTLLSFVYPSAKKIFSSITIFSAFRHAQHLFHSIAWHITRKTANSVMTLLS